MSEPYTCILCQQDAARIADFGNSRHYNWQVTCVRCGEFEMTQSAENELACLDADSRVKVSWFTRERSERQEPILILASHNQSSEKKYGIDITEILQTFVPRTIAERMDRILCNLGRKSRYYGDQIEINLLNDYPLLCANNPDACASTLKHLERMNLLDCLFGTIGPASTYELTPEAWERIEALQRRQPRSDQAFVAMWFDESVRDAREEGIKLGIEDAGYRPMRIDQADFNDKICDRIIAEIRKSRFVVADVTGQRSAVYFEAGFAIGLGLPVIYTCQAGGESQCFDTRQYNHILWSSPAELRERLAARIGATIVSDKNGK